MIINYVFDVYKYLLNLKIQSIFPLTIITISTSI